MKRFIIKLTVDNNLWGPYLRIYARRQFVIDADTVTDAYYLAANKLKEEKRYRNCEISPPENRVQREYPSWSINYSGMQTNGGIVTK